MDIQTLVDRILEDKILTREEQQALNEAILADNQISADEQGLLEHILTLIAQGEVKVTE